MTAHRSEGPGGEVTRTYGDNNWEGVITKTGVEIDRGVSNTPGRTSLKVVADSDSPTVVPLFETGPITDMFKAGMFDVDNSRLIYGTNLRTWRLEGKAYLEMRCHFPDGQESVSRSLDEAISGTRDWTGRETSFVVKGEKEPDNVKLNLVIDGKGTVWIGKVSLTLQHPGNARGGARSVQMDTAPAKLRPKAAVLTPKPPVTPLKPKPATKPTTRPKATVLQPKATTTAPSNPRGGPEPNE